MTHENIHYDYQYRGPRRPPGSLNKPKVEPADPENNSVAAEELKQFVERIERLEEEKKKISDDVKDVFAELKGRGFDTKAVRTIIRLRKQNIADRQEEEAILDLYKNALGMS